MAKPIRLLGALLAAQLALAVGLTFLHRSAAAVESDRPLLTFKRDAVDRITIDGPDHGRVVLARMKGQWQLPEVGGFPADGEHVSRLLDRLARVKSGDPVATTDEARERFKVADKDFERRIVLGAGQGHAATLYLGTSPAMRQVHARVGDQDAIYAVDLETYEVPAKPDDWEDRTLLQIPAGAIEGLDVDGLQLRRIATAAKNPPASAKSATWQAQPLAGNEHLDEAAVDKLVTQLTNLRYDRVLGTSAKPEYGLDQPALQITVLRKGGTSVEYRLGKMTTGSDYVLKSSSRSEYFALPSYAAQSLLDAARRDTLVPAQAKAARTTTSAR